MRLMATRNALGLHLAGASIRSRISHALAALACCYSMVTLLGWWLRIGWLLRIMPDLVPIHPHTVITFVALSFALLLSPWTKKWQQRVAMKFAGLAVAVGCFRIVATLLGRSLWIGDPSSTLGTAVMAVSTAIVFVCLGSACLCMMASKGRNWTVAVMLAFVAFGFGGMTLFGHLFQASAMYAVGGQVMALPTSILTVLTGAALLASRSPAGIVASSLDRAALLWFNLPIRYKCMGVLALPVACLTFEIGWQLQVLRTLDDAQQWTTHTQQVELAVAELQQLLLQIETNDRGFGLTGDDEFLVPVSQLESRILDVNRRLSHLVEDNPKQSERVRNLEALARAKVVVARDVTEFFATHTLVTRSPQLSLRLLGSKITMDRFMEQSKVFVGEEERLLALRTERLHQQQQLSQRVLILTLFTAIGTGLLGVMLFSWSVANRLSALKRDSLRMAVGERMPPQGPGDDEISDLALSLNIASFKIHDQMQALEALNHDLESFSYSVSHDLRSPLRHIHGFSKILQSDFGPELPAEAQRYLSRIESGAERMGHLIDDLLNFSRIGRREIERRPVPLRSVVDSIIEELSESSAGRDIEWQLEPLPTMQSDPGLIKQVFANLLSNAIKFTGTRTHALIEVGSRVLPQGTAIFVRDNGVGFDMKFADKLFGVFQRLHSLEEFAGTGVGLATVARIVHKHGGTVWAESAVEQGATFYFTLGKAADAPIPLGDQQIPREVQYAATR